MAKPRKKDQGTPLHTGDAMALPSVGNRATASPDRDRIAMRAYELYLARGGADGAAMDDWLTAERELTNGSQLRSHES